MYMIGQITPFLFFVKAESLWSNLGKYNSLVEQHFRNLAELFENKREQYDETIRACAQLKTTEWHTVEGPVAEEMVGLVQDFDQVRALLREMSRLSEVPIEPAEQTKLLDACMNVPGVAMAGVPGGKLTRFLGKNKCSFFLCSNFSLFF